jgi:hypothetical protein
MRWEQYMFLLKKNLSQKEQDAFFYFLCVYIYVLLVSAPEKLLMHSFSYIWKFKSCESGKPEAVKLRSSSRGLSLCFFHLWLVILHCLQKKIVGVARATSQKQLYMSFQLSTFYRHLTFAYTKSWLWKTPRKLKQHSYSSRSAQLPDQSEKSICECLHLYIYGAFRKMK